MITPAYAPTATERVLPRMALDFTTGVLDPRVTVARALNTATRVNASGLIEIVNADLPRFDYDPITLVAKGLLIEEARTNLVLQSENFLVSWAATSVTVTTNTTVAPDGTTTADTLTPSSTSGVLSQGLVFTGDGTKSVSVFLKAGTSGTSTFFVRDLTAGTPRGLATVTWTGGIPSAVASSGGTIQAVENYGNGWYRIKLLVTNVIAANSNVFRLQPDSVAGTGTVIAWGAQAENGAFATSYIPTTTIAVLRNADVVTMTGTNFSSWYNSTQGTFAAKVSLNAAPAVATFSLYAVSDGTSSERIFVGTGAGVGGNINSLVTDGGVTQAQTVNGGFASAGAYGYANAYKENNFASSANGGAVVADASGTVPTVNRLNIGSSVFSTAQLNGHMAKFAYYNLCLTQPEVQSFSK